MCYRDFGSFPESKEKLGRMLGPYKKEGKEMPQSIVVSSSHVITRQIVRSFRASELHSGTKKIKWKIFDDVILKKIGESVTISELHKAREHISYSDDVDPDAVQLPKDNDPDIPDGAFRF